MGDTPIKWLATAKRLFNESELMEKKQQIYLSNSQETETLRELKGILKEREEFVQGIRKKVDYFQGLLVKIHFKLGDAVNHSLNNPYQNWNKAQTVSGLLDRHTRDTLQQLLEAFESRLSSFRLTMRTDFDRLEIAEQQLTSELNQVEELVNEIESECNIRSVEDVQAVGERERKQMTSAKEKQERLEQEMQHKALIGEIDRELARIGRFGNWDVRDHDAFVRVWNHVLTGVDFFTAETTDNNVQIQLSSAQHTALMKKLRMDVFAKNEEELLEHVQWYCRHLELTHRKKLALSKWRRTLASRRHRQQGAMAADTLPEAPEIIASADNLLDQLDANNNNKEREAQEKRLAAKQRLAKWKQEREQQIEQARRQKIREQAERQQSSARERQRRQSELHDILENWKRNERPRPVVVEESRPSSADSIALKRRYKSDMEKAKLRKAQADMAKNMQFERERRFSELPGADLGDVRRDPARLLTATKASEAARVTETDLDAAQHRRESAGAHLASMAMTGRDLLHVGRATPAWLKPPSH